MTIVNDPKTTALADTRTPKKPPEIWAASSLFPALSPS
jgi:hypothetical protein